MAEDPTHQPHDSLFKHGFRDPANAAAFLKGQLPGLASVISWDRLRLENGSFLDSHLRRSESDLLFSAPMSRISSLREGAPPGRRGRNCLIYLLFAHQREFDRWIALRLLRYMVRIWEDFRKANPRASKLPVIVPVILAQNAERWEVSPQFASLLDLPGGHPRAPRPQGRKDRQTPRERTLG